MDTSTSGRFLRRYPTLSIHISINDSGESKTNERSGSSRNNLNCGKEKPEIANLQFEKTKRSEDKVLNSVNNSVKS